MCDVSWTWVFFFTHMSFVRILCFMYSRVVWTLISVKYLILLSVLVVWPTIPLRKLWLHGKLEMAKKWTKRKNRKMLNSSNLNHSHTHSILPSALSKFMCCVCVVYILYNVHYTCIVYVWFCVQKSIGMNVKIMHSLVIAITLIYGTEIMKLPVKLLY